MRKRELKGWLNWIKTRVAVGEIVELAGVRTLGFRHSIGTVRDLDPCGRCQTVFPESEFAQKPRVRCTRFWKNLLDSAAELGCGIEIVDGEVFLIYNAWRELAS